jgi:hypothetical protein
MAATLMLLPSKDCKNIRLVSIPEHLEEHEAFRHATGIIAHVEEENPDYDWEDIAEALEAQGFESQEFMVGPALDYRTNTA